MSKAIPQAVLDLFEKRTIAGLGLFTLDADILDRLGPPVDTGSTRSETLWKYGSTQFVIDKVSRRVFNIYLYLGNVIDSESDVISLWLAQHKYSELLQLFKYLPQSYERVVDELYVRINNVLVINDEDKISKVIIDR